MSNATLILPMPGLVVIFAMGSALNPLLVGVVAGIGMTLGEMTGYLAGYSGSAIIEDNARYDQVERYVRRFGGWVIFALALIPLPCSISPALSPGRSAFPWGGFSSPAVRERSSRPRWWLWPAPVHWPCCSRGCTESLSEQPSRGNTVTRFPGYSDRL
ncbi:MAG: VTT domain-containing protein [Anaerolineae bacterium]|nr:MAG: VTT domain-containing protein [Anaerolineae bacterium]